MDLILSMLSPFEILAAFMIALLAGFVKGVVGFAMPMIFISGLSSFIAPDLALAMLLLPTLFANVQQALRQGVGAAWQAAKRFWVYLVTGGVVLVGAAQLVPYLRGDLMLGGLGALVTGFVVLQLSGWRLRLSGQSGRVEVLIGVIAGFLGGISGVWGPPTVAYLTALNTEKTVQMQVQGVIYGLGAVVLVLSHLGSSVLNWQTAAPSALMIPPALIGVWVGTQVMDRIDQHAFRRATLIVLLLAGLNLIRRAIMG